MSYKKLDISDLKLLPLADRENKMSIDSVKSLDAVIDPGSISQESLESIRTLADVVVCARQNDRPLIWLMGAHVMRCGNSRYIIDLMRRGIITHIASNFALAIHDFELAYQGATLEDVERYIKDGQFGNWFETLGFLNAAIIAGYHNGLGMGESIGVAIAKMPDHLLTCKEISILATAYELQVPVTIHKMIGCDITDQFPEADFAAIGKISGDDFLVFANSISQLEGGVFLNLGSQVVGPEVYLKALSIARNLAEQAGEKISDFTTAVFDIVELGDWRHPELVDYRKPDAMSDPRYYFRPLKTILLRTVADGGRSHYIQGNFANTIPIFYNEIIRRL